MLKLIKFKPHMQLEAVEKQNYGSDKSNHIPLFYFTNQSKFLVNDTFKSVMKLGKYDWKVHLPFELKFIESLQYSQSKQLKYDGEYLTVYHNTTNEKIISKYYDFELIYE